MPETTTITTTPPTVTATLATTEKPGWATSEFWLKMLAILLTALFASGAIPTTGTAATVAAIAATMLGAIGYTVVRGQVKVANATSVAELAHAANDNARIDSMRQAGFIDRGLLSVLAVFAIVVMVACGAAARQRTITTALVTVDTAEASFIAFDGPHQLDIVAQALNRDDATEKLALYRKGRARFNLAMKAAYAAIRTAAQLDDDHSVAGMVAAVAVAAQEAATLGVTP